MTRTETTIDHIQHDLGDIKSELRELEKLLRAEFRLQWAGLFALAGIMAKGFNWF